MYLKKMFTIVFIFITSLICFSFLFSIVFSISAGSVDDKATIAENFFKLPLYIIGYGESPTISRYIQLILCVTGIIMVNFLNAYLTVALFRFKSVGVEPQLIKNPDSNAFTALFTVANKGKQIYNVSFMLQIYEEDTDGDVMEIGQLEFSRKLINSKKAWKIRHVIAESDLLYTFFKSHLKGNGKIRLQGILEYLDNDTGNQILSAREFSSDDFIKPGRLRRLLGVQEKHPLIEDFKQFVDSDNKVIDLHKVKKIVENGDDHALKLSFDHAKDKSAFAAKLDFGIKENKNQPKFIMALIENIPGEDWSIYYKMDYRLEFDICSSESVHAVQLEIKSDHEGSLTKIIDMKINTLKGYKHQSIRLQDITASPMLLKSVKEICFTCFLNDVYKETGEFKVKDLMLKDYSNSRKPMVL